MKKLILLAAALIASASPAHADPISAIAGVFTSIGVGAATAIAAAQFVVGLGVSLLAQAFMPRPEGPKLDVQFDVALGDDEPLKFSVGDAATAGTRKYVGSWGRNTRFITEVVEVSGIPQGLSGAWINDQPAEILTNLVGAVATGFAPDDITGIWDYASGVGSAPGVPTLPGGAYVLGNVLEDYRTHDEGPDPVSYVWLKYLDGTQIAADPFLVWAFGNDPDYPWTNQAVGRGKSYAILTWRYGRDNDLTSHPQMLYEPAPLALYDLRFDSTNGGSGSQRWDNPATWLPTRNPAVIAYNIIRGIRFGTEWVYGGKNLPAWRLPSAEWIAAANECDDPVTLAAGGTEPRYQCGCQISVDVPAADALSEIGRGANLRFAEVGGRIKPIVGLPAAPVFSFTDDDVVITDGQSFQPFTPLSETYNAISATYPSPNEKWATRDSREYVDPDATVEHGGRYLPTSVAYPTVPHGRQVVRLKRAQLKDYQRARRHQFYLPPEAYALEPGVDLVSWSSARNGYVAKLFLVESVAKGPGMKVLVSLREIDPGDYDWSSSYEQPPTIVIPRRPVRYSQPIRGLAVSAALVLDEDGVGRRPAILVACDGDEAGVTDIQIQARVVGRPTTIDATRRFAGDYQWYLTNVLPATDYQVRARLLSERTAKSVWSPWLSVTTPDVKIGPLDLEMAAIAAEVTADTARLNEWMDDTGPFLRDLRDDLDAAADLSAELGSLAALDRDQIRNRIAADFAGFRATYDQQIDVLTTTDTAIAASVTALKSSLDNKATASAVQALVTRVTNTEGQIVSQADAITQVNANVGRLNASGLFRVTAEATPTGAESRIGLRAEATAVDTTHSAALYLVANTDGTSEMIVAANRFAVATGAGANAAKLVPFIVDGGTVYMDRAFIRYADIDTLWLAGNAVTVPVHARGAVSTSPTGSWTTLVSVTPGVPAGTPTALLWAMEMHWPGGTQYEWDVRIRRAGETILDRTVSGTMMEAVNDWPSGIGFDAAAPAANPTYALQWTCQSPNSVRARGRLIAFAAKR